MRVMFFGACHEVTGSCHMVEANGKRLLIDCGMQQGPDELEWQEVPVTAADIDAVLLTHAHIDHSGLLPLLYNRGFRGRVYATGATCRLADIMLRDSAHIQMFEAEWRNRKAKRAGHGEYLPIYDMEDAQGIISLLEPVDYGETFELLPGFQARFTDVGHLLGSACIELWVTEKELTRKIAFSGDIGNTRQPLIRDPSTIAEADLVVMESTYGNRLHTPTSDHAQKLAEVIQTAFDKGGNVIIPSFAVGRTQELLYFLRKIKADGLVKGHGDFPVYVDSPLAIEATSIFQENMARYFDEEAMGLVRQGINPLQFSGLVLSVTTDQSKAINADNSCKVILSASGMCEAGRIRHHLKHNLWREECTVLFAGYQAAGTLGRSLLDGAESVKLFGEPIEVHAQIMQLNGVSAHADKNGLLNWVGGMEKRPKQVAVVHGAEDSCEDFVRTLRENRYEAFAPYPGAEYDLTSMRIVSEGVRRVRQQPARRAKEVYQRLVAAGQRLLAVIRRSEGMSNKDIAKFTDQVQSLCDKWER